MKGLKKHIFLVYEVLFDVRLSLVVLYPTNGTGGPRFELEQNIV